MRKTKNAKQQETPKFPDGRADLIARIDTDKVTFINVIGDSFECFGLSENDIALVAKTNVLDENALTAFLLSDCNSLRLGYPYDNFGDLAYFNGYEIQRYKKRKAEIYGIVIGVIKPITRRFGKVESDESDEFTFICDECKKTVFGTREFVESLGWKFQDDKQSCLNCDLKNE